MDAVFAVLLPRGPMSLREADEALAGPLGASLGFRRTKVVLPWTTVGPSIRNPPDTDAAVEVFVDAPKTVRECWETAVKNFAHTGREYCGCLPAI